MNNRTTEKPSRFSQRLRNRYKREPRFLSLGDKKSLELEGLSHLPLENRTCPQYFKTGRPAHYLAYLETLFDSIPIYFTIMNAGPLSHLTHA